MRPPLPGKKKDFQSPRVVFQPNAARGMQAGFKKLVDIILPTLGPLPHYVANEQIINRDKMPEILDSGGTIARRIIQIADRDEDVGLMYLRHVLWKLHETEGDGTATAAVLFNAVYERGQRYLAAGGNPMILRQHLESGMRVILDALERQQVEVRGKKSLAGLARTICYDEELSKLLGEIFDIIGAYGRLEVRKGSGREMIREYVEGMYWDEGFRSRQMTNAENGLRANLENAGILISDLPVEEPADLIPLLNLCVRNNIKQVLLVSTTLSEKAMGLLLAKPNQEKVFVTAVKTPGMDINVQRGALEDLAVLTGGRALFKATGTTLQNVKLEDIGRARRIWADSKAFGIIGGRGDPRALRQHIATLREAFRYSGDADERKRLLERLGKLIGGSATLYVGGLSPTDIEARVELAKRTADAMRGAMRDGVVPGGGVALLNCRAAVQQCLEQASSTDERAAYYILLNVLDAPFRTLVTNAGFYPGRLLAEIEQAGPDSGFDVLARSVVNMHEAGIFDSAAVVKGAVRSAIAGVALALTTDAIVHRRNPPDMLQT